MQSRVTLLLLPALALGLFIPAARTAAAPPANARPVGIVLQASKARLAAGEAQSGATVYDGDALDTAEHGTLQVRFGGAQAYLLPQSSMQVHQIDAGFGATLTEGTVLLSSANGASFRLLADGATIQPANAGPTVAQITRVNDRTLELLSSKGSLAVSMDGEMKTLTEGNSVRMLIQPGPQPAADPQPQAAPWSGSITYQRGDVVSYNGVLFESLVNNNLDHPPGGRSSFWNRTRAPGGRNATGPGFGGQNRFLWVALGLVGIGVGTALAIALISPDGP